MTDMDLVEEAERQRDVLADAIRRFLGPDDNVDFFDASKLREALEEVESHQ